MRRLFWCLVLVCGLATQSQATPILIDFEGKANGTVIDNAYPEATFTSTVGTVRIFTNGSFSHSGVNSIAPATAGGGFNFNGDMTVTFSTPVNDLSFWSSGDDFNGTQAQIDVFVNGAFASTVNLVGDGGPFTDDFQDLSAFSNVTSIRIYNVTDPAGLVYDDFQFVQAIPEPTTLAVFGVMAVGGGWYARRRKAAPVA